MFTLDFAPYHIEVFSDDNHDIGSSDNVHTHDHIYLNTDGYRPSSVHGIRLFQDERLLKSVAVGASGGGTTIHDHSCIVTNEQLVICCGDSVFCLAVPDLTLSWRTAVDMATCFGIYPYKEDYIIHGEMEITRLSKDGNIIWQQGGADIFTTLEGKDDFVITDQYILVTDFEHRKYRFDFDGNILE